METKRGRKHAFLFIEKDARRPKFLKKILDRNWLRRRCTRAAIDGVVGFFYIKLSLVNMSQKNYNKRILYVSVLFSKPDKLYTNINHI